MAWQNLDTDIYHFISIYKVLFNTVLVVGIKDKGLEG